MRPATIRSGGSERCITRSECPMLLHPVQNWKKSGKLSNCRNTKMPRNKANWMRVQSPGFKAQRDKLRPENTKAGGIKSRSQPHEVRMAVYRGIAEMFKLQHPICQACHLINPMLRSNSWTDDVHHKKSRDGLLLFDVRFFLAVCRRCHTWIGDHPKESVELGLSLKRNK